MNPGLNLNFAAVLIAVGLGISTFCWSRALHGLSGAILVMIVGATYFVGARLVMWPNLRGQYVVTVSGVAYAVLTAMLYFACLIGFNYIFSVEGPALARVTAISSTYPVVTAIIAVVASRRMLNWKEVLSMIVIVAGVVSLSLSGKH